MSVNTAFRQFLRCFFPLRSAHSILQLRQLPQCFFFVTGIAIGIIGGIWLTRSLSSMLFGVKPVDPLTFSAVTILLMLVSLAACNILARHATRVDPMVALRLNQRPRKTLGFQTPASKLHASVASTV